MKAMPPAIILWQMTIPITFLLLLFLLHSSHAAHVHAARRDSAINERLARSPDSDQIQHWKLAFSDDLAPSGRSRRLPKAVSCRWALNELCLRHVSCRELWTLFRRNCAVDAQNHCQMGNKNDCWQSFEGISWTGLGTCTCAGNNSDCHWIRLQTNYNKCIYELNNDAGWHAQLATAAQFSSRVEERVEKEEEEEVQRESVGVDTWTEERHHGHQWRAEEWENVKKKEEEEGKETKQKEGTVEGGQGVDEQTKKERVEEEKRKMDDKERERKEKQRESIEETQRKRNEEERRRRIEKEEQRKRRYEEERKRRWREEQRGKEENKAEERKKQVKTVERNGVEEKHTKSIEPSEKKRVEEKQTEERVRHMSKNFETFGSAEESSSSSSSTASDAGGNMHKPKKQKTLTPDGAKQQVLHIITTTVVPPMQRHHFLPTAESQRLVTQAEQPPTTTTASWRWTTTTSATTTTTFAPNKSNVLLQHEHPPASVTGTAASSASSISINSSSTSSSCPGVLSLCDKDEPCRWHMSELRIKCGERSAACGLQRRRRAQCVQALHRFVQFVHAPLAQALVFCTCANDDANCRSAMFPFLHECSDEENWTQSLSGAIAISQPQWTCTQTMKLCRSESDCRRRLSSLRSACPIASSPHNTSVAQCAASSLSACRAALSATRGSWLDEACACPAAAEEGTSCAELAEAKWPGHPCVEMVRQDFNERLRTGQIRLKTPSYSWHGSLPSAPADRHVFVHVGKVGGKGAMALGEEVTVPPSTEHTKETSSWTTKGVNRKPPTSTTASTTVVPKTALEEGQQRIEAKNGDDHLVHIEQKLNGVGRKKEVYEWAEDQEARKLEEDDHDDDDETSRKPNNNGTEIGLTEQQTVTKNGTEEWKMVTERLKEEELEQKKVPERLQQMNRNVLKTSGDTLRMAQSNKTGSKVHQIRPHRRQKTTKTTIKPLLDQPEALQHFVTQKPPSEGEGCTTRNVDGEWIAHYPDSVFRQYDDWAGRCSSWCECKLNGSMQCHQLGCVADVLCEARHTTIGFGQRLYLEDRGACQCHDGRFICDTSELMPELSAGLYITMGYSKAELDLIRQNVPKPVLERSGLISQSTSFAKDLAARLQFALERVLPEQTKCRVVLLEHFAQEEVLLMQLQWFGMQPNTTSSKSNAISSSSSSNKNDNSKPKWHSGKWEKLCAPYVRELEQNFLLERADRYQLLLSTIKQIRVIDLLEGLPQAFSSSSSTVAPLGGLFVLIRSFSPEGSMLIIVQILFSLLIQLRTFW